MSAPPGGPAFIRRIHPLEEDELTKEGHQHCGRRRCGEAVALYAWYHRRTQGRLTGYERYLCTAHGEAFAARHHMAIEDAPPASELSLPRPGPRLGAYLEGMSAQMLADHEAFGWHCDSPRCRREARYLSSYTYKTPAGRFRRETRFLCDPHARRFAGRHGVDLSAVLAPEEGSR